MRLSLYFVLFISFSVSAQDRNKIFFDRANDFFAKYVSDGKVRYAAIKKDKAQLDTLIKMLSRVHISPREEKALLINAYNLAVIHNIVKHYPVESVMRINGFFDDTKFDIAGKQMTLDRIEKQLIKIDGDPRLHFVLVCGALSCPDLAPYAFVPDRLEAQLDELSARVINDDKFVKPEGQNLLLSQIFQWYIEDFGGKNHLLRFLNKYRQEKLDLDANLQFAPYDWTINDSKNLSSSGGATLPTGTNLTRYIVAASLPKGGIEIKNFNNLYTQRIEGVRSTFHTNLTTALYGVSSRLSLGFISRYRRVLLGPEGQSPFAVLTTPPGDALGFRQGLTAFGPAIRWAAFGQSNSTIQASLTFPIGAELKGNAQMPFIDFQGAGLWVQWWRDRNLGSHFSLFTDFGVLIEDVGFDPNRFSYMTTFLNTIIGSYYPEPNTTLYGLVGFAPIVSIPFEYFYQLGLGIKYRFTQSFEAELLYTHFNSANLLSSGGSAATYNFGIRYSNW